MRKTLWSVLIIGISIIISNLTCYANDPGTTGANFLKIGVGARAVALRAGYRTGRDVGLGWTAGLGFKTGTFGLDYAYAPYGDLGNTHRISLGIGF